MSEPRPAPFQEHFAELTAPRVDRGKLHLLLDILVIALCAVLWVLSQTLNGRCCTKI